MKPDSEMVGEVFRGLLAESADAHAPMSSAVN
jgi:hypothetical protein